SEPVSAASGGASSALRFQAMQTTTGRKTMSLQQRLPKFAAALMCVIALAAGSVSAADSKEGSFTTSDGVRLHYIEAGSGDGLVMIPGWSQSAAQFKHQLSGLSDRYRVI